MKGHYVLGIWDGHDAGVALVEGDEILFAANEERFTRRKLEVGFPRSSIEACLRYAGLALADIETVAASTSDPAKTLSRLFPGLKDECYLIRRREANGSRWSIFGYHYPLLPVSFRLSHREDGPAPRRPFQEGLQIPLYGVSAECDLRGPQPPLAEAVPCGDGVRGLSARPCRPSRRHASAAAACSGFPETLVFTFDGVGDGLSGSLWT